jgi:predicted Na+-dependent transporter
VNSRRFGRNVVNSVLLPVILAQIAARFVPEQLFRARVLKTSTEAAAQVVRFLIVIFILFLIRPGED